MNSALHLQVIELFPFEDFLQHVLLLKHMNQHYVESTCKGNKRCMFASKNPAIQHQQPSDLCYIYPSKNVFPETWANQGESMGIWSLTCLLTLWQSVSILQRGKTIGKYKNKRIWGSNQIFCGEDGLRGWEKVVNNTLKYFTPPTSADLCCAKGALEIFFRYTL